MQENHLAQFIQSIKVTSQLIYFGFVLHKRYLLTSTLLTIFKTLAKQKQLSFVHMQFMNSKVMLAFFLFNQKKALKKIRKCLLFQLKNLFRSVDIQFFVISFFFPNFVYSKWKLKNRKNLHFHTSLNCGCYKVFFTENIYQEFEIESLRSRRRFRKLNLFHIGAI